MGCPNLEFESSGDLLMVPAAGSKLEVGQAAVVTATVHNDGTLTGTGEVTFYWQQQGVGKPIQQIPANPPNINPVPFAGVSPGSSIPVSSEWIPTTNIVGTAPEAKGYLYATVSTTAILPSCPGSNPAPAPDPSYPGPVGCIFATILN
jgi:hypothetical protein